MKRLLFISMLFGAMPMALLAQDDDLYFVPKKASKVEKVTDNYGLPKDTYYSGSDRTVDDYNRRTKSTYVEIEGDSTKVDVIEFTEGKGVYPDSLENEDFKLTKKMSRFDGYDMSEKAAYWAGYERGRYDWGWHSPWYYRTYGWYGWYDPWYYGSWYDPWYYGWGYPYYHYGYYGYYGWDYPYYVISGGGSLNHTSPYRHSPRQPFASERSSSGSTSGRSGGRGSFGASRGRVSSSTMGNASYGGTRSGNGSFGASRPSSSSSPSRSAGSSGSYGGGSHSSGGSFGGSGGGSHSGGGGGFGRHR